ncbi:MAG: AAA family ATPase, partial [Patescibacteria group bacterium]|nr:AAA family ATPase [Patescibacteria group bacterium]
MNQSEILEPKEWYNKIVQNINKVFFGKENVIRKIIIAILSKGHVLLEDVPGVGKTILSRAIANSIEASFSRIQCTPDLLPADILGVSIYNPKAVSYTHL